MSQVKLVDSGKKDVFPRGVIEKLALPLHDLRYFWIGNPQLMRTSTLGRHFPWATLEIRAAGGPTYPILIDGGALQHPGGCNAIILVSLGSFGGCDHSRSALSAAPPVRRLRP
jgi:hypothetical protein